MRGHPDLNRGPLDLQSNALPLSYTPADVTMVKSMIKHKLDFDCPVLPLESPSADASGAKEDQDSEAQANTPLLSGIKKEFKSLFCCC